MRTLSASSFWMPTCAPPSPRRDTVSPVRPSLRRGTASAAAPSAGATVAASASSRNSRRVMATSYPG